MVKIEPVAITIQERRGAPAGRTRREPISRYNIMLTGIVCPRPFDCILYQWPLKHYYSNRASACLSYRRWRVVLWKGRTQGTSISVGVLCGLILWKGSLQEDVLYSIPDQAPTAATHAPMAQNYQASNEMTTLHSRFEIYPRLDRKMDERGMRRDQIIGLLAVVLEDWGRPPTIVS